MVLSSQRMREVRIVEGDSLSRREDKMGEWYEEENWVEVGW